MTKKVNIDIVARDKTKRAIDSSKKSLGGLKKFALAAGAALATIGAGRAITGLVRVGKEIESLQIRFKILFGSAEEGAKAFDNLTNFAAKVPFSLGDIAAASGNLAVVAKDADELTKILEITGNVAGATGLDFQTTASQIQRAFAGGIASADIFREKGVRDMLGFSAGAKVSVEETIEAFKKAFAGNGEFAGTTKALAGTLEGTLSMINDKFLKFQLAINEAFFAELKKQFGDLNKILDDNQENWEELGKGIGESLADALGVTVETLSLMKSAIDLTNRALDKGSESGLGFGKIIDYFRFRAQSGKVILSELGKQILGLGPIMDEIIPIIEKKGLAIDNLSAKHSTLGKTIVEETSPALTQLEQDILDLELALQPLGNAFDIAFAPLDEALAKSEENRKQILEKSFSDFKNTKFKEIDFEKMTQKEREQMTKAGFRTALSEGAKHNKAMFRLNQALNIGEAIMNTATGISAALKLGPVGIPLAVAIGAMGAVQIATIASQQPPAQFGGSRLPNSPFLVGEKGPELFTPNTAGSVTPNHQLGGGGATVNFNITTVDAQSFGTLLDTRRGQIVNMINSALNNKGQAALV